MMLSKCRKWSLIALGAVSGATAACSSDTPRDVALPADVKAPLPALVPAPVQAAPSTPIAAETRPAPGAMKKDAAQATAGVKPRRIMLGDVDLTGVGYDVGSPTAPVVMIDLSDFACPYCGEFSLTTYPTIEREYVKTGKVLFKYVPFIVGSFPNSAEATRAVECAAEQGAFWPMMTHVYEGQGRWRKSGDPYAVLSGIAGGAGLDTARIGSCYASRRTDVRTAKASSIASDLGVRVTPSFVVNERPVQGALPIEEFRKVIDAALMVTHLKK
jgi:protein-disulfide isomerase